MLYIASAIICLLALLHSALGERYIVARLLRRADLPKIFGSSAFTANTLRYCWHLTSVMALGMSVLLIQLGNGDPGAILVRTIAITLYASGALAIIVTRGRHLSWIGLIAAAILCTCYTGFPTI